MKIPKFTPHDLVLDTAVRRSTSPVERGFILAILEPAFFRGSSVETALLRPIRREFERITKA